MESPSVIIRLEDILAAIEGIRETVSGQSFETFRHNWSMVRATERGLEIISEASRSIPDDLKQIFPDVPWSQIAGIGNILRHEYQRVDPLIVWNIIGEYLNQLANAVHQIRKNLNLA